MENYGSVTKLERRGTQTSPLFKGHGTPCFINLALIFQNDLFDLINANAVFFSMQLLMHIVVRNIVYKKFDSNIIEIIKDTVVTNLRYNAVMEGKI